MLSMSEKTLVSYQLSLMVQKLPLPVKSARKLKTMQRTMERKILGISLREDTEQDN